MPEPHRSEPTRQYMFSERQVRAAFVLSALGMLALLLLILLIATSRPQGRLKPLDPSQFQNSLAKATADLNGYALLGDGRARIDIDHAMQIVADRGVSDLKLTVAGGAPAGGAQAGGGQAGGARAGGAQAGGAQAGGAQAGGAQAGGANATPPAVAQATPNVDGSAVYQNCAACHQANGQGIPGAFPPLAGHLPAVFGADRNFPPKVVLFGMTGAVDVGGQTYNSVMPPWKQLSDAEIAAVLNHELTSWGNQDQLPSDFQPYTSDDIAAARKLDLSSDDVYQARQQLKLP